MPDKAQPIILPLDDAEAARRRVLEACKLRDNPFDPERDGAFDFVAKNVSLLATLDVFRNKDLEPYYFAQNGCFNALVQQTERFLTGRGRRIEARGPFSVLVSGAGQVGMNSAALYIAHMIRERLPGHPPLLDHISLDGNDYSTFLQLLTAKVKSAPRGVEPSTLAAAAKEYEELIRAAEASPAKDTVRIQTLYFNLLRGLEGLFQRAEWLIVIVENIDIPQRKWISDAQKACVATKVLPIYLTRYLTTRDYFEALVKAGFDGLLVSLEPIDSAAADEFARARLDRFRHGAADAHFPFTPGAIRELVQKEDNSVAPIKWLIPRLSRALERKLEQLDGPGPIDPTKVLIDFQFIRQCFNEEDLTK